MTIEQTVTIPPERLDEVRQLLKKEMAQNGTMDVQAVSGDGWEAHVREKYAEQRKYTV
jgi:nitrogen regulatory protein PII